MRVLIVTYYWPPAGGSGVQRWLKFVKYLADFGVEPVIFTADGADYPVLDESLSKDVPDGVEVVRGKIWEPNMLLGKGKKKESSGFLDPNPSITGRLLQFARANYFIPDARKFWVAPSVKTLKAFLKDNPVDLMITTGPPHSVHLIGYQLKMQTGIKWISDFRDPWTNIDYFHQLPMTARSRRRHEELEQKVLQHSDAVIVVGKSMRDEFKNKASRVKVITNGYDTNPERVELSKDEQFTLVHLGMMNADRNPEVLWKVVQELLSENKILANDLKIRLIGKCSGEVRKSVEQHQLQGVVEFVPYLSHDQVHEKQEKARVLLLCVNRVPSAASIITGKVFEYLQTGNPILAIGPKGGDLDVLLQEVGAGNAVDFDDEESLKKRVLKLYERYRLGEGQKENRNIEKYHRRNLTGELVDLIREVTES